MTLCCVRACPSEASYEVSWEQRSLSRRVCYRHLGEMVNGVFWAFPHVVEVVEVRLV